MARKSKSLRKSANRFPGVLGWFWRLVMLLFLAFVLLQLWFFAHIWYWREHNPASTAFMRAYLSSLEGQFRAQVSPDSLIDHQWVPYEQISDHLKRAVVASEDDRFMLHGGFDWEGIRHAMERNRQRGEVVAGGSTITQQLAKNLFLSNDRSYWRKGQEALIALMLEMVMDKRRILEIYLNVVEWGEGIYGIEAAAWHYYGQPAASLGPDQSACLAAMLPQPRFYQQNPGSLGLARRSAAIQSRMHRSQIP